jgi:hypothetical protein
MGSRAPPYELVCGDLPHLPRLLSLEKPSGGVPPIAVGEVWCRLAALCALAAARCHYSLAFREAARWSGMSADPSCMNLQVDWHNAFDILRRDHMLVTVEQFCPALLVAWAFG